MTLLRYMDSASLTYGYTLVLSHVVYVMPLSHFGSLFRTSIPGIRMGRL